MKFFILTLISTFLSCSSANAKGFDQVINEAVAPVSDAVSNFVFYPIQINGVDMPIIIMWLLLGAVIFTIATKFIGIWGFNHAINIVKGEPKKDDAEPKEATEGEVSSFQALATALSGTVGLGNIAGVAIAISIGGPGATLWMWLGAILGMASKFVECTLGVKYRRINEDGSVSGGPMHYLSHGLTKKKMRKLGQFLAVMFSWMCIAEAFGGGNMFQINNATIQIIETLKNPYIPQIPAIQGMLDTFQTVMVSSGMFLDSNKWIIGLTVAIIVGLIILGGIKGIAKVTEKIVPFMVGLYVIAALVVILGNITEVPNALSLIFTEAFAPRAVEGGIIGTIIIGLRRSVQSNEAGVGSAPIAYAAVQTKEPVSQGFVSLLEPFIDTIVLCSMTAFVIIITGMHSTQGDMTGSELTSSAFATVMPFFPYILTLAIVLFALSTLISWAYYGQKAWTYLFGEGKKRVITYQIIFLSFIVIGSSMNLKSVVDFTDAMMFAMAVPNMIGMYILLPEILRDLKDYCKRFNVDYAFNKLAAQVVESEEAPSVD